MGARWLNSVEDSCEGLMRSFSPVLLSVMLAAMLLVDMSEPSPDAQARSSSVCGMAKLVPTGGLACQPSQHNAQWAHALQAVMTGKASKKMLWIICLMVLLCHWAPGSIHEDREQPDQSRCAFELHGSWQ